MKVSRVLAFIFELTATLLINQAVASEPNKIIRGPEEKVGRELGVSPSGALRVGYYVGAGYDVPFGRHGLVEASKFGRYNVINIFHATPANSDRAGDNFDGHLSFQLAGHYGNSSGPARLAQDVRTVQIEHGTRVHLSVGGAHAGFLLNDNNRQTFLSDIIELVEQYGFSGLDWNNFEDDMAGNEENENQMEAVSTSLKERYSNDFWISSAPSTFRPSDFAFISRWESLDFAFLQVYGSPESDAEETHTANWFVKSIIDRYTDVGTPQDKIVFGFWTATEERANLERIGDPNRCSTEEIDCPEFVWYQTQAGAAVNQIMNTNEYTIRGVGQWNTHYDKETNWGFSKVVAPSSLFSRLPQLEFHLPIQSGTYYLRNRKASNRWLDAHETSGNDFNAVTRPWQGNDSQLWLIEADGSGSFHIRQKNTRRYLDAHETSGNDFNAVTRPWQGNDSQKWIIEADERGYFRLKQRNTGRYLDFHETSANDFRAVTRTRQSDKSQQWSLTIQSGTYYIRNRKASNRWLDAHESSRNDFNAVTRTWQGNDSQLWLIEADGSGSFHIRQMNTRRYLDAHETSGNDFNAVTRTCQGNDSQRWFIEADERGYFRLKQRNTGRYLDFHETSANDFRAVTRTRQSDKSQLWSLERVH